MGLLQSDWCPYRKKKLGHRHTQRDDQVRTQGEDGHLHTKEGGLRRNQTDPANTLICDFQPLEL